MFSVADEEEIIAFKERKIRANKIFSIREIGKADAYDFVRRYHYLGDAKFFSVHAFGLIYKDQIVGVATYSNPQGTTALRGWFGLDNTCGNVFELSRLCMLPCLNKTNATSFLLGGSIHAMKVANNIYIQDCKKKHVEVDKDKLFCRAVITLACAERHIGSIYSVCNFKYYGLANVKSDFYDYGTGKINPRGEIKDLQGVWLPRARKHRYAYILDKELVCKYEQQPLPKYQNTIDTICCNGTKKVFDDRFKVWYTCPCCTGRLELIDSSGNVVSRPHMETLF